ncbi:Lsa36 family surface (lipo)protein [Treponema primitia]|uniref:Lsa36 family surface (lipo)protein n=1 Tax=Treponema primitia TaxID=88058 RepID=UPI00025553D9|nr:hypothetical protein [Treponema primitia]
MKYFGKFVVVFVLFTFIGVGVFALEIKGTEPKVTGPGQYAAIVGALNSQIKESWNDALDDLNEEVEKIDPKPEKLIKGFADASVFASHGATQRGYGEPDLFTFTIGSTVGVKIGSSLSGLGDYFDSIADELEDEGDLSLGLNIQAISGQFNLNTSRWLLDGLDLGFRFGMFKLDDNLIDGFGFNTLSLGVVGNYQLLKELTIVPFLLKWRGLSLGTGLIYQNTKLNYSMDIDVDRQAIGQVSVSGVTVNGGYINIDPKLVFDMTTNTVTIPLEATTAVHLLSFLNIALGVGVDIAFGGNDMNLKLSSDVTLEEVAPGTGIKQSTPGTLSVSGGGDVAPTFFNPKLMTGIGFKIGPVILDIPVTLYFGDGTGLNAGITLGVSL